MKQTLEEAIHAHYNCNGEYPCGERNYCEHCNGHNTAFDCCECGADEFKEGFLSGAEWQAKQSPWISANKYPPIDKPLLLNYSNGSVYDMQLGYYDGCHYCNTYGQEVDKHIVGYMPIPSFDEILEANRVKEKGD